jgi:hypothetical protein
LLRDEALHARVAAAAARSVRERFCVERVVPMYEDVYRRAASARSARSVHRFPENSHINVREDPHD